MYLFLVNEMIKKTIKKTINFALISH